MFQIYKETVYISQKKWWMIFWCYKTAFVTINKYLCTLNHVKLDAKKKYCSMYNWNTNWSNLQQLVRNVADIHQVEETYFFQFHWKHFPVKVAAITLKVVFMKPFSIYIFWSVSEIWRQIISQLQKLHIHQILISKTEVMNIFLNKFSMDPTVLIRWGRVNNFRQNLWNCVLIWKNICKDFIWQFFEKNRF